MGGDDGHHGFAHYFRKKTVYVNYGPPSTAGLMPYDTPVVELPPQLASVMPGCVTPTTQCRLRILIPDPSTLAPRRAGWRNYPQR
jgi:hypothetical protein